MPHEPDRDPGGTRASPSASDQQVGQADARLGLILTTTENPMRSRDAQARILEDIRRDFVAAMSRRSVLAIDDARQPLRDMLRDRAAARDNMVALSQDAVARSASHPTAALLAASSRYEDIDKRVVEKRQDVARAIEAASLDVAATLEAPISEACRVLFEQLSELEAALDPLIELQARLNDRGLPLPRVAGSAHVLGQRVREMRQILRGH